MYRNADFLMVQSCDVYKVKKKKRPCVSHPQAECAFMAQDISAGRSSKNGAPWKQTDGRTDERTSGGAGGACVYVRRQHTAEPCKDEADLAPSCVLVFFVFLWTHARVEEPLTLFSWCVVGIGYSRALPSLRSGEERYENTKRSRGQQGDEKKKKKWAGKNVL